MGRQQLQCPHTSSFFLNPRALLALPAQPVHVPSMPPPSPLPVGAGWAFPDTASEYNRGREFWSSLGSSVLWLQRHSWFISQKMKTTDTVAYKPASPLGGKEHVEENAPWDCSLRAAVASGLWHRVPSQENQRPFRQKRGRCRKAAGHWWWASGPVAQRHLYLGTPGSCPLDYQDSKISKFSTQR